MGESRWTHHYVAVMQDLGWPAKVGDQGDLCVSTPVGTFLVENAADDPAYLHLGAPYLIPGEMDPAVVDRAAADVAEDCKLVALVVEDDVLTASIQLVLAGPGRLPDPVLLSQVLPRCVSALFSAAGRVFTDVAVDGIARASGLESGLCVGA